MISEMMENLDSFVLEPAPQVCKHRAFLTSIQVCQSKYQFFPYVSPPYIFLDDTLESSL